MSVQKIRGWVEEQQKRYAITSAELHHSVGGRVERFPLEEGMSAFDFAKIIWDAAVQDSDLYPGLECAYVIFFYGSDPDTYTCRRPFRYSAVASADRAELTASEPPNETGQTQMLMRHLEGAMRINERMCLGVLADAGGREARLQAAVDRANEAQMSLIAVMRKQSIDQAALEDQREERRQAAAERARLWDMAELAMPLMAGYLLKPQAGSVEEKERMEELRAHPPSELTLVMDFVATLTPEQYAHLGALLNPFQQGDLIALQRGELPKEIIPITIARVMQSLTDEQINGIWEIIKDSPAQVEAFKVLFATRQNTLAYQRQQAELATSAEAMAPAVSDSPPPNTNGGPN
jgi:hypothetical protein